MKGKKKQTKKPKPKINEGITRVLVIGKVDIDLTLELTERDLTHYGISFENFSTKEDLNIFEDKRDLWVKVKLTSADPYISSLIYLIKASKTENYIDFIPLGYPSFSESESFFKEIFKLSTEINGIFINENGLMEGENCSVSFNLIFPNDKKTFTIKSSVINKEEEKDENESKEEQKEENKSEAEKSQNAPNPATLKFSIRNKESPFNNMHFICKKYEMFFINFDLISSFPSSSFQLEDFIDLLVFLQSNKCTSIIKYSKSISSLDMEKLNNIFFYTDIFIFNFKESIKILDAHYKYFSNDQPLTSIDDKKVFDYFTMGIATSGGIGIHTKKSKVGLFLDEFSKFTVVEVKGKNIQEKFTHMSQPYPKINHTNYKLVEEYKTVIKNNYGFLEYIFYSGILSKISENNGKFAGQAILYPAFLKGIEIVTRVVEILKNGLPLNDIKKICKVKVVKEKVDEFLKQNSLDAKEGNFVLDCVNLSKSSMKEYMPLYDYHLNNFFLNGSVRKELKNKGFINTRGFIMYDPVYRSVLGSEHIRQRSKSKEKKDINKEILSTIKKINISENYNSKEIDSHSKAMNSNVSMGKKLPSITGNKNEKKGKK